MNRDDIIRLRKQADDWTEQHLQCVGEYHPDFHTVSDERFAALLRDQMLSDGWRQCAQGQRTTQHCAVAEQARQEAERYKASASMWRNKAYELGGTPLPWDADEMLEKARQEEREWLAAAIERQARSMSDHFETRWLHEIAAAVRARGNA